MKYNNVFLSETFLDIKRSCMHGGMSYGQLDFMYMLWSHVVGGVLNKKMHSILSWQ